VRSELQAQARRRFFCCRVPSLKHNPVSNPGLPVDERVPSSRFRLAIVSDYCYPDGGVEQVVRSLLSHAPGDIECDLVAWNDAILRPPNFDRLSTIENGDVRGAWATLAQADVVMVHTSFNVRLLARLATEYLRVSKTPALCVVHTSCHSNASAASVNAQTVWLQDLSTSVEAALHCAGIAPTSTSVIENGSRFRTSRRDRDERKVVSFIGRPFVNKGFDLFVKLAEELLVGRPQLSFHANTVSVPTLPTGPVELTALLSDDEYLNFLDGTDVLIAPYRGSDGLPLAILEALNCGVPVIGLDSAGLGELLRRHHQLVLPDFESLQNAVVDWADYRIELIRPPCTPIPSWEAVSAQYFDLARKLGGALDV